MPVFVIQEQKKRNLKAALKYGELQYLFKETAQATFSPGQVVKFLMAKLSRFSDKDYLLLCGDPVAIGIATTIAAHWNQGKVKLLKWDRLESIYYPVQLSIFNTSPKE